MNYGMMFSEELQKQGARAIPTVNVMKELIKRKDYNALSHGIAGEWGSVSGKVRPYPYRVQSRSLDPLEYKQQFLGNLKGADRAYALRDYYDIMKIKNDKKYVANNIVSLRPDSQPGKIGREMERVLWDIEGNQNFINNAMEEIAKEKKKFFPFTRRPYPQYLLDSFESELATANSKLSDLVNNTKWV